MDKKYRYAFAADESARRIEALYNTDERITNIRARVLEQINDSVWKLIGSEDGSEGIERLLDPVSGQWISVSDVVRCEAAGVPMNDSPNDPMGFGWLFDDGPDDGLAGWSDEPIYSLLIGNDKGTMTHAADLTNLVGGGGKTFLGTKEECLAAAKSLLKCGPDYENASYWIGHYTEWRFSPVLYLDV